MVWGSIVPQERSLPKLFEGKLKRKGLHINGTSGERNVRDTPRRIERAEQVGL